MKTDVIHIECLNQSPFRTVAWRWEYTKRMLGKPNRAFDESSDAWVTRAMRHLSADKTTHYPSPCKKPQIDPSIRHAQQVYEDEANVKLRWFLEALMLSGEPLPLVAERCGLPIATVEVYGKIFFDVRSSLCATDWLLLFAVRSAPYNNFAGADAGCLWRYHARFGGIKNLELYMAATGDAAWPDWLPYSIGTDSPQEIERFKMTVRLKFKLQEAQTDEEVAAIVGLWDELRTSDGPKRYADSSLRQYEEFLMQVPKLKRRRPAPSNKSKTCQSTKATPHRKTPQPPAAELLKHLRKLR